MLGFDADTPVGERTSWLFVGGLCELHRKFDRGYEMSGKNHVHSKIHHKPNLKVSGSGTLRTNLNK